MIKVTFALRRRADLTLAEFHAYWGEQHAALVRRHAAALGIRRYVQSHTLRTVLDEPLRAARSPDPEPFDGLAEIYFDSVEALLAVLSTDQGRTIGAELVADEQEFVDLARSPIWITEEHVIVEEHGP
jgi:uncharacterized protein (TIGR02118 family)